MKIFKRFFIKSKTNQNEFAKQYFTIAQDNQEKMEITLIITKLVLSNDINLYKDYEVLKTYKEMRLFRNEFVIKMSTFREACRLIFNNR